MKAQVTSYVFYRTGTGYEFVSGDRLVRMSEEMMQCLLRQYKIMGFQVIFNNDLFIAVGRVENEIDLLFDKLNNK